MKFTSTIPSEHEGPSSGSLTPLTGMTSLALPLAPLNPLATGPEMVSFFKELSNKIAWAVRTTYQAQGTAIAPSVNAYAKRLACWVMTDWAEIKQGTRLP